MPVGVRVLLNCIKLCINALQRNGRIVTACCNAAFVSCVNNALAHSLFTSAASMGFLFLFIQYYVVLTV